MSTASTASHASDLVRDSQLRTAVSPGLTHHTYYISDPDSSRRRTRTEETWHRRHQLGNGTFGRVWLEDCKTGPRQGQLRAVKEIPKDRTLSSSIDYGRELEAMAKFSNDKYVHCFVRSFGWYESRDAVFIAMEYLEHGDLQKHLDAPFPEIEAKQLISQLAEGLLFMHDNGFAHRDMKPANVLVMRPRPDWWVKISDFGISKRAGSASALRTVVGTQGYLAPELIGFFPLSEQRPSADRPDQLSYTTAVDIWALGEITVRVLTHRTAFPDVHGLFDYVVRENPFPRQVLADQQLSDESVDFVERTMAPSPSQRLKATEAVLHPWLQASRPSSRASSRRSISLVDSSSFLNPLPTIVNPDTLGPESLASVGWSTLDSGEEPHIFSPPGSSLLPSSTQNDNEALKTPLAVQVDDKSRYSTLSTFDSVPIDEARADRETDNQRRPEVEEDATREVDAELARLELGVEEIGKAELPNTLTLSNPIPIVGSLTGSPDNYDDIYYLVVSPFPVTLYGHSSTQLFVNINGTLSLDVGTAAYANRPLPCENGYLPAHTLLPFWCDLYIYKDSPQGVYYDIGGEAPSRILRVEWYTCRYGNSSAYYHFNLTLEEAKPNIATYNYFEALDKGIACTIGAQGPNSAQLWSYNEAKVFPGAQVRINTSSGLITESTFQ